MRGLKTIPIIHTNGKLEFKKEDPSILRSFELIAKTCFPENKLIAYEEKTKEGKLNEIGVNTLIRLGFFAEEIFGRIIILGENDRSPSKKQKEIIQKAYEEALLDSCPNHL